MPCYHPQPAFRDEGGAVRFYSRGSADGRAPEGAHFFLPCTRCIGCRLERSRQWAVRCMHEASLSDANCYLTLTYSEDCLPPFSSLNYVDFQLFMKRLRRRFSSVRIRFYMAGEYGESFSRPHFHALLFGFDFPDREFLSTSPSGFRLDRSAILESLWPFGFSSVGAVTFESAAYVARYCTKKITGPDAREHYATVNTETGELSFRSPEFNRMSLKPGIGASWFSRFKSDVYPRGFFFLVEELRRVLRGITISCMRSLMRCRLMMFGLAGRLRRWVIGPIVLLLVWLLRRL